MLGLLMLVIVIALGIALAPIILGVIGTMLGLIFTFILWAVAGFPDNTPKDTRPPAAQHAPAHEESESDPMKQLLEWERQDKERARQHRAARRRADHTNLLDAQRRVHSAEDEVDHDEP